MSLDDPNTTGTPAALPATPEPPKPTPSPQAAPAAAPIPPQIQDFDALIKGDVQNFVNLGEKIGGLVAEQVWKIRKSSWTLLTLNIVQSGPTGLPG